MKHDHLMPLPVALEDLRQWLIDDTKFKGKVPVTPAVEQALDQLLVLIDDDHQMATLLAGYTHACPACIKVPQS